MRLTFQLGVEVRPHTWAKYNDVTLDERPAGVRTNLTNNDPTERFPLIAEADGTVTIR